MPTWSKWSYRDLNSIEPSAGDVLVRDNLHQTSLKKALQLAFRFARAESALIAAEKNPQNPAHSGNLQQTAAKAADRVSAVAIEAIAEISWRLRKSPDVWQWRYCRAQQNELSAELDLAEEIQATIKNLNQLHGSDRIRRQRTSPLR